MVLFRSWPSLLLVAIFSKSSTATSDKGQQVVLAPEPPFKSWNFNFSSPAPHYFASVQGLLQQWPNTFFPNGHSILPSEIPPYTKFYHGRTDGDFPQSPEWLAFDIEMAYGIMGSTRNSHMLTYQTTRPIKAIYFDGESATLMGAGRMDTQMLQIYLNTSGAPWDPDGKRRFGLWDEYDRANGLCTWIKEKGLGGSGWGFEGIVRMNAGFEMIWCDFESPSLKLVSHLNVTAPLLPSITDAEVKYETSLFPLPPTPTKEPVPADPMPPPNWRRDTDHEPFLRSQGWGWFTSATDHYGFSGMGPGSGLKIKTLTCAVMNYYSPDYQSQAIARAEEERKSLNLTKDGLWIGPGEGGDRELALKRLMRRRRSHRLDGVSVADASAMKAASENAFSSFVNGTANCSGLDWTALMNEIVQRHATDLFNFVHLLSALEEDMESKNETELQKDLDKIRAKSHKFLLPFLEYPTSSDESANIWETPSDFGQDTYSRCRYHHTRLLVSEFIHLNPQESLLKWSVEETFGGICSTMIEIGFSIERLYQEKSTGTQTGPRIEKESSKRDLAKEITYWHQGVEELMSWLGWAGNWVRCEKQCAWDEKCFIPMWPMIGRNRSPGGGGPPGPPGDGPGDGPGGRPDDRHRKPGDRPDDEPPPDTLDDRHDEWPPEERLPMGVNWDLLDDSDDDEKSPPSSPENPGRGRRPGRGRPGGGGGGPGGGGPGWMFDESDLWEPKCVKADYIMH